MKLPAGENLIKSNILIICSFVLRVGWWCRTIIVTTHLLALICLNLNGHEENIPPSYAMHSGSLAAGDEVVGHTSELFFCCKFSHFQSSGCKMSDREY